MPCLRLRPSTKAGAANSKSIFRRKFKGIFKETNVEPPAPNARPVSRLLPTVNNDDIGIATSPTTYLENENQPKTAIDIDLQPTIQDDDIGSITAPATPIGNGNQLRANTSTNLQPTIKDDDASSSQATSLASGKQSRANPIFDLQPAIKDDDTSSIPTQATSLSSGKQSRANPSFDLPPAIQDDDISSIPALPNFIGNGDSGVDLQPIIKDDDASSVPSRGTSMASGMHSRINRSFDLQPAIKDDDASSIPTRATSLDSERQPKTDLVFDLQPAIKDEDYDPSYIPAEVAYSSNEEQPEVNIDVGFSNSNIFTPEELRSQKHVIDNGARELDDSANITYTDEVEDDPQELLVDVGAKERKEIFEWISPVRPENHHEELQKLRFQETGEWLLFKQEYKDWIRSDSSSIFWLHGKAGSGKSVLCSYVKDSLRETFDGSVPVVFFYCHYEEEARREAGSVLRSLLKQLSAEEQSLEVHKDLVTTHKDSNYGGYLSSSLSYYTTETVMKATMSRFKTIFIVVDALDECSTEERRLLVKFLLDQAQKPVGSSGCTVKIFLTSRDEVDLSQMLSGVNIQDYTIDADDTTKDIDPFVRHEVASYINSGKILGGNVSEELKEQMVTSLIDNADGMFLWVKYQLLQLCDAMNPPDLENRLKILPIGLKSTYNEIWSNIGLMDDAQRHLVYKAMRWILSATKPMKSDELLLATSIEPGDSTTYDRSKKASDISSLIQACQHLIVEDEYGYIRFMHYSVEEFVREQAEIQQLKATIATTCLVVLGTLGPKISDSIYEYACNNWHIHFTDLTNLNAYTTLITAFLLDEGSFEGWWYGCSVKLSSKFGDYNLQMSCFEPVIVAAGFNLVELLKCFLEARHNSRFYVQVPSLARLVYTACYTGSFEAAELLLELGADVNEFRGDWGNVLEAAARWGNISLVEFILKAGADVNAQGEGDYGSALQAAAGNGKTSTMKLLFEAGANVNAQGGRYGNALQAAAYSGEMDSIKLLLVAGADVNAQGGEYSNALQAAAQRGRTDAAKLLIKAGADVNAQGGSNHGYALDAAVDSGKIDLVKLLLEAGANVNAQGEHHRNALETSAKNGNTSLMKLLLEAGASVNTQGGILHGSALQEALANGKIDAVKLLLNAGADVNAQGGHYGSTVRAAAYSGNLDLVKLLLEAGADVNAQGGDHGSALQTAARNGKVDLVKLLLEAGADVNAPGGEDGRALQAAAGVGRTDLVELLLEAGADVNAPHEDGVYGNALESAAYWGDTDSMKLLLSAGANVNAQSGKHRNSALQTAAYSGKIDAVKMLLMAGADVDAQRGEYGSALQAACRSDNSELVKLLLKAGADINAQGGEHGNALYISAISYKTDMVKLLLEAGANVNAQGGEYGNALQGAAWFGRTDSVKLLLEAGADFNAQGGKYGIAAQAAAAGYFSDASLMLLLEAGADTNIQGGYYGNCLQAAATQGIERVNMLINAGIDLESQLSANCGFYGNALQSAAHHEESELVDLFIKRGADVNAKGGVYGSALQAAVCGKGASSSGNYKAVFKRLLDAGADLNVQGGKYGNVLYAAINNWGFHNHEMLKLVLEAGFYTLIQMGEYGSALNLASLGRDRIYKIHQVLKILAEVE